MPRTFQQSTNGHSQLFMATAGRTYLNGSGQLQWAILHALNLILSRQPATLMTRVAGREDSRL